MITAETAWWRTAGPENIWGLDGDGITGCLGAILPAIPERGTVLDLGCGPGRLLTPLHQMGPDLRLIGLDVRDYGDAWEPGVEWHVGDGRNIPAGVGWLDGAYSIALFQHLPHAATCWYLRQVADRLRPGARIVFQHVLGDEDSFLSHQIDLETLDGLCSQAGLTVETMAVGVLHHQWVWVTAHATGGSTR